MNYEKLVDFGMHEAAVGSLVCATAERMQREHETLEIALSIEGRDTGSSVFRDAYTRLSLLSRIAETA